MCAWALANCVCVCFVFMCICIYASMYMHLHLSMCIDFIWWSCFMRNIVHIWWCFTWFTSCRFYFDFSPTYIGCGLICPHIVNCSVLLGAIISWGFLWPFISQHAGDWYPADLGSNDFKGLYGYKVWWNNLFFSFFFKLPRKEKGNDFHL